MCRALCIDTDVRTARLLAEMLARFDYHTIHHNSWHDVTQFEGEHWDIVIIDLLLLEKVGKNFVARLKNGNPDLFTIVTSSYTVKKLGIMVGYKIEEVLLKPIRLADITSIAETVLRRIRGKEALDTILGLSSSEFVNRLSQYDDDNLLKQTLRKLEERDATIQSMSSVKKRLDSISHLSEIVN